MHRKIQLIRARLQKAYALMKLCRICPRRCEVKRLNGDIGYCSMGFLPVVSSANLHFGEEPPISGHRGSGTLFFAGCNLGCVFCQNYPISQLRHGNVTSLSQLAKMMLHLQDLGAHNLNFVTPTHFAPQLMGALLIAYQSGLRIPLVYNCGGYESLEMIQFWDGIVDIYMPDMKYADPRMSEKYSHASDYPEINRQVIKEMFRQVGNLKLDTSGIAVKGLLIRHLVLPENISGTHEILHFISNDISKKTAISLMSQYFPAHQASSLMEINRKISPAEYAKTVQLLEQYGLKNGWIQELKSI